MLLNTLNIFCWIPSFKGVWDSTRWCSAVCARTITWLPSAEQLAFLLIGPLSVSYPPLLGTWLASSFDIKHCPLLRDNHRIPIWAAKKQPVHVLSTFSDTNTNVFKPMMRIGSLHFCYSLFIRYSAWEYPIPGHKVESASYSIVHVNSRIKLWESFSTA